MPHDWKKTEYGGFHCANCNSSVFKADPTFIPSPDRLILVKGRVTEKKGRDTFTQTGVTQQLTCDEYQAYKVLGE